MQPSDDKEPSAHTTTNKHAQLMVPRFRNARSLRTIKRFDSRSFSGFHRSGLDPLFCEALVAVIM